MEPDEAVERVGEALGVCSSYRATFVEYRGKVGSLFPEGKTVVEWDFHSSMVFSQLDVLEAHLHTIQVRLTLFIMYIHVHTCIYNNYRYMYIIMYKTARACIIHVSMEKYSLYRCLL